MNLKTHLKCALTLGASTIAIASIAPSALAQDGERKFETVVVTTQKQSESIQDVPIAVSAFDESTLEKMQLAGGPDLVKSIPNVTFTKGNFTGFNFKIRGIGADLVATSGDTGVGVHQNDVPLAANRLFEAEFYDVERVETLRGPQGTLYGRNATGGVVNIITAKPVFEEFQANVRGTYGSDNMFKVKGMVNVPLGEKMALRLAGSALTRDGFAENTITGNDIDGRNLWSVRATLAFEPTDRFRGYVMYEHFEEDDNRLRSGKQLCKKDPYETSFGGIAINPADQIYTTLGCQEAKLSDSYERVNSAGTLGGGLGITAGLLNGDVYTSPLDPNLRNIESAFDPRYQAEQTLITWQGEYDLTDALTLTYLGSFNESKVVSEEDYNKATPDVPFNVAGAPLGNPALTPVYEALFPGGMVSDPQIGNSNFFRTFDLSGGISEATSHELRMQSDFDGRFNFNLGAIYYEFEANQLENKEESYYIFSNSLTGLTQINNALGGAIFGGTTSVDTSGNGGPPILSNIDGTGRNYYRSISPYNLESFAVFGEGYFDVTNDLQLTVGVRYTSDDKEQLNIPTFLFVPDAAVADPLQPQPAAGAPDGVLKASFEEVTGRIGFDWAPDLSFSEDSLFYAFYSKGYKGGGINPPQPVGSANAFPQVFDPEFINAWEIGTKNTLADGALQLNATAFWYDYEGYQITQIINRTSANFNIDAKISGFELETIWSPNPNLMVNMNLGLLDTSIQDTWAVDVLDRANGRSDLVVLKNASSYANCVVSAQGYATVLGAIDAGVLAPGSTAGLCTGAFAGQEAAFGVGNVTYVDSDGNTQTVGGLTPFDGEAKDLDGNSIPGTPDTTFNLGAEYSWYEMPEFMDGWIITARGDYYYQADSFSRVWNTPHDQLDSWDNLNLTLRFDNDDANVSVEFFGKNVMDEDVITGAYLTDDSSGLFTNVFLNEPATYGVSLTKRW